MKKDLLDVIVIIVLLGVLMLSPSLSQKCLGADYVDTLWGRVDTVWTAWTGDITDIDEEHEANEADYIYALFDDYSQGWRFGFPADTSTILDSAGIFVWANHTTGGENQEIILHYQIYIEEWVACTTLTVTLTQSYDAYLLRLPMADPDVCGNLLSWQWYYLSFWGATAFRVKTVAHVPQDKGSQWRVAWTGMIYWHHSEEVEEEYSGKFPRGIMRGVGR